MADGRVVEISVLSMPEVTGYVPEYNMTESLNDLKAEFSLGREGSELPPFDEHVGGGSADILHGAEYLYLFPQVFSLPLGLSIGEAKLASASGQQGVIWGVHPSWNRVGSAANAVFFVKEELKSFLSHSPVASYPFLSNSPIEFFHTKTVKDEAEEATLTSFTQNREMACWFTALTASVMTVVNHANIGHLNQFIMLCIQPILRRISL